MKVALTQPVEIALRSLSEDERRNVMAWLEHLEDWQRNPFVRGRSHRLASGEGVYVLPISGDLRVFFTVQGDQIVALDIAKKATIMRFVQGADRG